MKPARLSLIAAASWFLLGIAAAVLPSLVLAWAIFGGVLLAVMLLDAALVLRAPVFSAVRRVASSLPVGVWSHAQVRIANPSGHSWRMRVYDHYPQQSEA